MKKFYTIIVMVFFGASILYAGDGLSQPHLVSTTPSPNDGNVPPNTTLSFTFDRTIVENSVKLHTVTLTQKEPSKQKIKGSMSVVNKNTLVFSSQQQLEKGMYEIKIKPLKLRDENAPSIDPKTKWQKFIAWLCGLVYDDINDCPLCQYVCNIQKNIETKPIHYQFEVKDNALKVTALDANVTLIELSEHNSTIINVTATYDDNSTENVTQKATYTSNNSSVDADKGIITTNTEGSATVTITYGAKTVNINVEVYELIERHLLPHEPENPDATLLGVDANDNGVRDEVERWIYKEMPTYHHPEIERVVAMTEAKAYQMVLVDPANKDDKVHKSIRKASDCWSYYSDVRSLPFDGAIEKFSNRLMDKVFNTRARLSTFMDYENVLSAKLTPLVPFTPLRLLNTSYCDQNIDLLP